MRGHKIRHALEAIVAGSLFTLQNMPAVGPWISLMFIPLGHYLILYLVLYPEYLEHNLLILFSPRTVSGQMVTVIGLIIFLMACIQFLRKRGRLVRKGLYSVVRHPQYLGIVIMTLGLSIICVQLWSHHNVMYMWLVEVLGYILLASFEEHHLLKDHKVEYQEYRRKIPFFFPVRSPSKIPQPLFTMILALIIAFPCMLL